MNLRKGFLALVVAVCATVVLAQGGGATAQDPALQRRITLHVENEKLSTIFTALTEQGVNLVIPSHLMQNQALVTITVRDQPIGDLMNALAAAVGGDWIRQGDIYVFVDPATMMRRLQVPPDVQIVPGLPQIDISQTMPAPGDTRVEMTLPATAPPFENDMIGNTFGRLLDSVTDAQWERMWKRGYLRWSELSKYQKNLVPSEKSKGRQTFKDRGRRLVVR